MGAIAPWGRRTVDPETLTALRDGSAEQRLAGARALLQDDRIKAARVTGRANDP